MTAVDGPSSRRDQRREETLEEIKQAALAQLAEGGPFAVSMRGIARQMRMTASAVHYYFPSRQALVEALVLDAFRSLTVDLRTAYEQTTTRSPVERWMLTAAAHRDWALNHPEQYALSYGAIGGLARLREPAIATAMAEALAVLFDCMRDMVEDDQVDAEWLLGDAPPDLLADLEEWRTGAFGAEDLSSGQLLACMLSYTRMHGAIALELVSHMPPQIRARGELFELLMRHSARSLF